MAATRPWPGPSPSPGHGSRRNASRGGGADVAAAGVVASWCGLHKWLSHGCGALPPLSLAHGGGSDVAAAGEVASWRGLHRWLPHGCGALPPSPLAHGSARNASRGGGAGVAAAGVAALRVGARRRRGVRQPPPLTGRPTLGPRPARGRGEALVLLRLTDCLHRRRPLSRSGGEALSRDWGTERLCLHCGGREPGTAAAVKVGGGVACRSPSPCRRIMPHPVAAAVAVACRQSGPSRAGSVAPPRGRMGRTPGGDAPAVWTAPCLKADCPRRACHSTQLQLPRQRSLEARRRQRRSTGVAHLPASLESAARRVQLPGRGAPSVFLLPQT